MPCASSFLVTPSGSSREFAIETRISGGACTCLADEDEDEDADAHLSRLTMMSWWLRLLLMTK